MGSGIFSLQDTARPMAQVLPDGVRWLRDAAAEFKPAANQVVLKSGATISYDYLVVAMGLQCDWHLVPGLPEALARGDGVCSNYGAMRCLSVCDGSGDDERRNENRRVTPHTPTHPFPER